MHTEKTRKAEAFARAAHSAVGQVRKYTGEPYIVHPIEVAETVRAAGGNENQICAAYLHDTVEDTNVTLDDIAAVFGHEVATLVEMLTDVSKKEDGNRETRKAIDLAHTAKCSAEAATVKLADLISNTRSIIEHDHDFARVYLREKKATIKVLTHGDPAVWDMAARMVFEGEMLLEKFADRLGAK